VSSIAIVDRVTLAVDDAPPWIARLRAEYAPAAADRGMRLTGTWCSYVDADAVEVLVLWELPDVAAFWAMKRTARSDPSIDPWWEHTDTVAIRRDRRVYAPAEPS
jgi:hypothetical protein